MQTFILHADEADPHENNCRFFVGNNLPRSRNPRKESDALLQIYSPVSKASSTLHIMSSRRLQASTPDMDQRTARTELAIPLEQK